MQRPDLRARGQRHRTATPPNIICSHHSNKFWNNHCASRCPFSARSSELPAAEQLLVTAFGSSILLRRILPHIPAAKRLRLGLRSVGSFPVEVTRDAERVHDLSSCDIALVVEWDLAQELAQGDGSEFDVRFREVACMGEYVVVRRAGHKGPALGGYRRLTCVGLLSAG